MRNLYCLKTIKEPSHPIPHGLLIRLITDPAVLTFWSKRRARLSWTSYQTDLKMSVIFRSHVLQNSLLCEKLKLPFLSLYSWGIILTDPIKRSFLNGLNHIIQLWYWLQRIVNLRSMSPWKRSNLGHDLLPRVFFWESGFQTRSELITGYLSGILRKQNKSSQHKQESQMARHNAIQNWPILVNGYCACSGFEQCSLRTIFGPICTVSLNIYIYIYIYVCY